MWFCGLFFAPWLSDAIGNIVVSAGVVIYPMVIDGNKAPENPFVNNMKER